MKAEYITPALTIFDDSGMIDYKGNAKLIRHLIDGKVDGMVPLGSTGEFTILPFDERKKFLDFYFSEVSGSVKLVPGTGCTNFNDTVALSNHVLKKGAEAVLVICQYYYGMRDEEIFHYYNTLAKAIEGNVYLYNFPARTSTDFTPELVLSLLRENKNIVGMKESVSTFAHTRAIMDEIMDEFPDFRMYSGFDDQFLDNIDYGGCGSIGAISNILPTLCSGEVAAKNAGDQDEVLRYKHKIHRLMRLYSIDSNCSGLFKEILKARGMDICTYTHFPFDKTSSASIEEGLALVESVLSE